MRSDEERYQGRPFVRLLDLYVLALLDQLSSEASEVVDQLVRSAFTSEPAEPWTLVLEKELHLPTGLADQIKAMWRGYQAFEQTQGRLANPIDFTRHVVDENFLDYIKPLRYDAAPSEVGHSQPVRRPTKSWKGVPSSAWSKGLMAAASRITSDS